ncbi:outer membrane immunogenic protein [Paracoccus pantotrophus]|uniref:Outer membrane immunogenic protein n=1 Tax=Paracoccus pantotrophus TaxID=82367 RepID=A0AAE6NZG9_PARPN|nr:porin family protein [Paracoccus pantotrophus]RKS51220.1 outer membrane immunogenic protein [Paracoccus pantotrophus]
MCAVSVKAPLTVAVAASLTLGTTLAANAGGFTPPIVDSDVTAPVVEAPAGEWAGGYAGLTLGYAFAGDDAVGVNGTTVDKLELGGANAGVRLGYRWQRDRWVIGPELGFEAGNVKDSFSTAGYDAESKVKNLLALRLKTGYVLNSDVLLYGIAGVARAKVEYSITGNGAAIRDDYSKTGYVVGLGAEKKLTDRMSLTGEYEYANFGTENLSDGTFDTNATPDYHNLKLGLNFKF